MREDTSFMNSIELADYLAHQQRQKWPGSHSIRSHHARQLKKARRLAKASKKAA